MLSEQKEVGVIPTCTNPDMFVRSSDKEILLFKKEIGFPEDSLVMIYSGALGGNYPIKDIFLFLQAFLSISTKHYCLILSKENLPNNINLPERTVLKSVRYSEVPKHLSVGNFGLIYYAKAFSNIGRSPTKLGEYWACGLQVISPSGVGDVEDIFKTYSSAGFIVNSLQLESIRNVLEEAINSPISIQQLREASLDYFSLDKGVEFYKELYRGIHTK